MNVKELKELASEWTEGKVKNIDIVDAIRSLPDDPQAEPRKVDLWAVMLNPTFIHDTFTEIEDARAFVKDNPGRGCWLARLTGTEEV